MISQKEQKNKERKCGCSILKFIPEPNVAYNQALEDIKSLLQKKI